MHHHHHHHHQQKHQPKQIISSIRADLIPILPSLPFPHYTSLLTSHKMKVMLVAIVLASLFSVDAFTTSTSPKAVFSCHRRQQQLHARNTVISKLPASQQEEEVEKATKIDDYNVGLYKKFADHAYEKLSKSIYFTESSSIPNHLQQNQAPAKGMDNSIVKISTKAFIPST